MTNIKKLIIIFVAISISLGVIVFIRGVDFSKNETKIKKDKLRVQAGWLLNGEFANVCSAIVNGFYDEENLEVELIPGGPSGASFIVATTAVAQDSSIDIGIDGDLVPLLKGVTKQKETEKYKVRAFASFWTDNPYGFMVRKSSGITSLKDFSKRKPNGEKIKIGVTADAVIQEPLSKYAGVEVKELDFITVGFDATPLLVNQVDALAGYWTTQAYELEKAKVEYRFLPISELPGFEQPSMIAVASEKTLNEKKDRLVRWLRATIKGSEFVIKNPEKAARDILDARCGGPSFKEEQELWLIRKSIPLFDQDNIGGLNFNQIEKFVKSFYELGQISSVPERSRYLDTSILDLVREQ
jgi:NitT/TauT family transport system substrate-binding protein